MRVSSQPAAVRTANASNGVPAAPTRGAPRAASPDAPARPAGDAVGISPVVASGDLFVDLADVDGVVSPSRDDLQGQVRADVAIDREFLLSRLRAAVRSDDDKTITRIAFDAKKVAYLIEGHVKIAGFRGPSFSISMTADAAGRLVIDGSSWLGWLLRLVGLPTVADRLAQALQGSGAPIHVLREGERLVVAGIQDLPVPLGSEQTRLTLTDYTPEPGRSGPFKIDPDGRILVSLAGAVKGELRRTGTGRPGGQPDRAALQVQFVMRADRSVTTNVTGSATLGITQTQLDGLMGPRGEILHPLLKSGSARIADLRIDGNYTEAGNWDATVTGRARIETPQGLRVDAPFESRLAGGGEALGVIAGPVDYRDPYNGQQRIDRVSLRRGPEGIALDVSQAQPPPLAVGYQANRLGLLLGGDRYFTELLRLVAAAREGIMIESLGFSAEERPTQLLEALLQRAGGLGPGGYDGKGLAVRLLVDPTIGGNFPGAVLATLEGSGTEPWARRWVEDVRAGKGRYAAIPPGRREEFLTRVRANLRVQEHPGGLARADHRKVVVVDGLLGVTGGINIGQGHLSTVQDVMVPVIGPAVRDMAEAFLATWEEDGGAVSAADRAIFVKPAATSAAEGGARFGNLVASAPAQSRVLLTDDRRQDIETAYLEAIGNARRTLELEQQYITDDRVVAALEQAVRRGVAVTIVVPEDRSDEFGRATDLAMLRLLQASSEPGAAAVDLRYYQTRGEWRYYVHSKVLVADGERTLVGSANLEQRAMRGLAWTGAGRLLWNKELDLDVADGSFAQQVGRDLFGKDTARAESRDIWEQIAARRLEGERAEQLARLGAAGSAQQEDSLASELQARYRAETNDLLAAIGDGPARRALQGTLADTDRLWAAQWSQTARMANAVREAARGYRRDPAGSEQKLRELGEQMRLRIAAGLPAGRGSDAEQHLAGAPLDALLARLRADPDGAADQVGAVTGTWALATAHLALVRLEGAQGAAYRAGGYRQFQAVARQALRPDEREAQVTEALAKLL
ncbi:MAG: phosphatidylserine/phosphatidylglycerophosphate/cardiolipin synthase family protein [Candidatus Sericytochromatia bacterium]|nr:phosphatidylserine/phosphatidylglycerophosphate/cardiolipin synthase family protein [Candidatus Tanganyikabacteria bacterium]